MENLAFQIMYIQKRLEVEEVRGQWEFSITKPIVPTDYMGNQLNVRIRFCWFIFGFYWNFLKSNPDKVIGMFVMLPTEITL